MIGAGTGVQSRSVPAPIALWQPYTGIAPRMADQAYNRPCCMTFACFMVNFYIGCLRQPIVDEQGVMS
jgi:hypothetical protein